MPTATKPKKRMGRPAELDKPITLRDGRTVTFEEACLERIRTGIPLKQAAGGLGVRMQTIHDYRRKGVRLRSRQIAGEEITDATDLAYINFADRCDEAEAEAFSLDWTRHGQVAAGGIEQVKRTVTTRTDPEGKQVRTEEVVTTRTLPHERALRWRLAVRHGLTERVEISGPDGGPIPVEQVAANVAARLAAFVEAAAVEVPQDSLEPGSAPSASGTGANAAGLPRGSTVAERVMDWPSPDVDVPPPPD